MKQHYKIQIQGLVQGVGFRPFVYRVALDHSLKGTVENRNDGVIIKIIAEEVALNNFVNDLNKLSPVASSIDNIHIDVLQEYVDYSDFSIVKSTTVSDEITEVSPDISVCPDCLADMKTQDNRINYPFINCTNCGPRFSIITDLPYDRELTSMKPFAMCNRCRNEYTNILDRRFHAQPVACNDCGPHYEMVENGRTLTEISEIISRVSTILEQGGVLAIKGIGGYFICCDASNDEACQRIRAMKNREAKPFAVMFRDAAALSEYVEANTTEVSLLESWRKPIVLINQRKHLSKGLNSGLDKLGCMLPYMPFHYLLFEQTTLSTLVMTSGNISEEPIVIDDAEALETFSKFTDAVLTYNRRIANRCDDSVLVVVNEKPRLIRRSRGFVPNPIRLSLDTEGILAVGAELKNTFAIGKGNQCIISQHIGDLKNIETYNFYTETAERFARLFRFKPAIVACDLHPDYISSRFAEETGLPLIKVQHHHAHIASVLAETGHQGKVIGVSFDGTGLGDDNAIWGGEFFLCDLKGYERLAHIAYKPLPGGDAAANHPWRMACSYLYAVFGTLFTGFDLPMLRMIDPAKVSMLIQGLEKGLNSPMTSSAGRLFDAASALCGLCTTHSFEAEGPMLLESIIQKNCEESYSFELSKGMISFDPMFFEMTNDLLSKIPLPLISARFHNTIVNGIVELATKLASENNINTIALSGGVFMNAYLLSKTENALQQRNMTVLTNLKIPANDGGIALGQLAVVAATR